MNNNSQLDTNTSKILSHSKNVREFLNALLDEQSFVETDMFMSGKSYLDGSEALGEGVVTGYATLNNVPVTVVAQNREVLGGSIGRASAEKIVKAINRAIKSGTALISVVDSQGARIGEGVDMLEAYGKLISAMAEATKSVPTISVLQGSAVGLMGMYVAASDFVYVGDKSVLSVNPPLTFAVNASDTATKTAGVEAFATNSLVPTFKYSSAEELKTKIADLFTYLEDNVIENADDPNRAYDGFNGEITAESILKNVSDENKFCELYAGYATDVRVAFSSINAIPVGMVVTNGEKLSLPALKKIKKFVKLLDTYSLPLVTFLDSKGIVTDAESERGGEISRCAKLIAAISNSDNPKIAVITGNAVGYPYIALASKSVGFDYVLALSNATVAPVTAEQAVSILYSSDISGENIEESRKKLADKYALEEANPFVSAKDGYIDNIIEPALMRPYIASALAMLAI